MTYFSLLVNELVEIVARRPNQRSSASLPPGPLVGGGYRSRTDDPLLAKQVL